MRVLVMNEKAVFEMVKQKRISLMQHAAELNAKFI